MPKPRKLKVLEKFIPARTEYGRHRKDTKCPTVRLAGKWMLAAGFHPGQYIDVTAVSPGVIELRVCSGVQLTAEDFHVMGQLDRAIERTDGKGGGE